MERMDLRIFTEPQQGASYETLLSVAKATEEFGFDAFFRSDHYLKMGSVDGLPGPTDAWITLAGLARETSRIRLGVGVVLAPIHHPLHVAQRMATLDILSHGRVDVGIGRRSPRTLASSASRTARDGRMSWKRRSAQGAQYAVSFSTSVHAPHR